MLQKRKLALVGAACVLACTLAAAVPLAGFATEAEEQPVAQADKAAVAMEEYAPEVTTLEDGTQVQTVPSDPYMWNTAILKGDQRGCTEGGCHDSILEATQELDMPHPELWNPYNVDPSIKFCYMCHSKALYFQDSMHALHMGNALPLAGIARDPDLVAFVFLHSPFLAFHVKHFSLLYHLLASSATSGYTIYICIWKAGTPYVRL